MEANKMENYIFNAKPKITNIDIRYMAALQRFYLENGFIPEDCVNTLLDWLITRARLMVCQPLDIPTEMSYRGCCSKTQKALHNVLEKIGFDSYPFNIGTVLTKDYTIHALDIVKIPVLTKTGIIEKYYMLDPTFRQFCLSEENKFEKYFEKPRDFVRSTAPHPGYFLNLTKKGRVFANDLIENGYFELTDDNVKLYFDSFALYLVPKEKYPDKNLLGKVSQTDKSSEYYLSLVGKNIEHLRSDANNMIESPLEVVEKEENKFINKIKGKFKKQKELKLDDFYIDDKNNVSIKK